MILPIIFVLVLTASILLALRSMGNYRTKASQSKVPFGVFLVQKPEQLTVDTLNALYATLTKESRIISFERLAKGSRKALVIYGPKAVLTPFTELLGLLELEDYAVNTKSPVVNGIEVGMIPNAATVMSASKLLTEPMYW
jgi:hypothetical protein